MAPTSATDANRPSIHQYCATSMPMLTSAPVTTAESGPQPQHHEAGAQWDEEQDVEHDVGEGAAGAGKEQVGGWVGPQGGPGDCGHSQCRERQPTDAAGVGLGGGIGSWHLQSYTGALAARPKAP